MASRCKGPLRAWRITDIRYSALDGSGASRYGGRWNSPGRRAVYAAETYSGALLEVLVHASGRVPGRQVYTELLIPEGVPIEEITAEEVSGWDAPDFIASRAWGDRWIDERRTLVLLVPSVIVQVERNVVINPEHPNFSRIRTSEPRPVRWDARLLRERT